MNSKQLLLLLILLTTVNASFTIEKQCERTYNSDEISLLEVTDINRDLDNEILVGTSRNGVLDAFDYQQLACKYDWQPTASFTTDGGIEQIVVADVDRDGYQDIVINGAKSKATHPKNPKNYVQAVKAKTLVESWRDKKLCQQTSTVTAIDLNHDSNPNVLAGGAKKVCAFDDINKKNPKLLWTHQTPLSLYVIKAEDLDMDDVNDIVLVSSDRFTTIIEVLDEKGLGKWKKNLTGSLYTQYGKNLVKLKDLDEDGVTDIIVATNKKVYAESPAKGRLWEYSPNYLTDDSSLTTTLDINDFNEKIYVGARPTITAINYDGTTEWSTQIDGTIYSIDNGDLDGDFSNEIVVASYQSLYILDVHGKELLRLYRPTQSVDWHAWDSKSNQDFTTSAQQIHVRNAKITNLDKDSANELVIATTLTPQGLGRSVKSHLEVFEVVLDKKIPTTTTTIRKQASTTIKNMMTTTTLADEIAPEKEFKPNENTDDAKTEEEKKGFCCLPALPILILGLAALLTGRPIP